jgi:ribonuclease T1
VVRFESRQVFKLRGVSLQQIGLSCTLFAAVSVAAVTGLWSAPLQAREPAAPVAALPAVKLAELPQQARQTYRLILAGGPFPYEKDGTVFGNRERLLPRKPRGYYHEYTVPTPAARNRGAKRIVCAGEVPREPEACFYTEDHYASFKRIAP